MRYNGKQSMNYNEGYWLNLRGRTHCRHVFTFWECVFMKLFRRDCYYTAPIGALTED